MSGKEKGNSGRSVSFSVFPIPENFSHVSSENQTRTASPSCRTSFPSAFLPFRVMFFFRRLFRRSPDGASGSTRRRYRKRFCPASVFLMISSFIAPPFHPLYHTYRENLLLPFAEGVSRPQHRTSCFPLKKRTVRNVSPFFSSCPIIPRKISRTVRLSSD